jgi:hypothetical protein
MKEVSLTLEVFKLKFSCLQSILNFKDLLLLIFCLSQYILLLNEGLLKINKGKILSGLYSPPITLQPLAVLCAYIN